MKKTYVSPSGNLKAKIVFVGDQPGIWEVRQGKPFVGPAGKALIECMRMAKLSRTDNYFTNVIKDLDKPLKEYINIDSRGKSTISKEGYQYIEELKEELEKLNPNIIIALGNIALLALTNRIGITKWRGSILESTIIPGLKVIPTFHPATFIPPKFNFINRPIIIEDLLKAKKESEFPEIRRIARNIKIRPTFSESISTLNHCYRLGLQGQIIDIDIEIIKNELDCIAFAWSPIDSICIPFRDAHGDYFTIEQEYEIMLAITKIFQSEKIAKRGANFIFDAQYLLHKYGIVPNGEIHCTQIAQKIAFPDLRAGLDAVTAMHSDIPYYKQDGKQWMKMGIGSWETWWTYNGMDAIATSASHPNQMKCLKIQENIEVYDRQRKLIKPLIYMSERGIKIDVFKMLEYKKEQEKKLHEEIEKLNAEVGYEINPNSPLQIANYFYSDLKIKPYKNRKTGRSSTDVDALKRISRRGYKAAQILLNIRSLSKRISTYLNIDKIDNDGRYKSSYKPVGTSTGRLASGETIFGKGGNQQNWPHDLLRFFIFDDNYIGYSFDLSQAENRIVAYVGGVVAQIEAFENGIDLHKMTASIIFNKPYNEISSEDGSSSLGDGRQSERFWGKKGNHAINYDTGYKTFALVNEINEVEAKHTLERIHKGYPQIRQGYHQIIQGMLKKNRTVVNLMGRKRLFLGPIIPAYPNISQSACTKIYREAYAQLSQSTVADKINEHGVEYIYYNQNQFHPIELLTQIHDSVVFQIPRTIPWLQHAEMLIDISKSLEQPLYWKDTKINFPADLAIGLNMCKDNMIEIKSKDFPKNKYSLSDKLQQIYKGLKKA